VKRLSNPAARRESLRLLKALSRARRDKDPMLARAYERAISARDAAAPVIPDQLELVPPKNCRDVPPRPSVCPECTSRAPDILATLSNGLWMWLCRRCAFFGREASKVVQARSA
jgi:hypothetical protein